MSFSYGIGSGVFKRIASRLSRKAQSYSQSPSGLWMPVDYGDEEEEPMVEETPTEVMEPEAPPVEPEPEPKQKYDYSDVLFIPVESSNIQEFGYDDANRMLYVKFLGKGNSPSTLYVYEDVEPEIYEEFFNAPSKGKFLWAKLRDKYPYLKLE